MNRTLASEIEAAISENPDRIACICPVMGQVTYAQFSRYSERLSTQLQALGATSGDRIVIYARRSAGVVVAMRAALSIGACYVPIASTMPPERIEYILADSAPRVVICDDATFEVATELAASCDAAVIRLQISANGIEQEAMGGSLSRTVDAEYGPACYILYTSGSTGTPKGVVVSPANVLDYIDWAIETFRISADDRVLSTAPFYFDMSVFDVYVSLMSGATLVIASEKDCMFPSLLLAKIENHQVTVWKAVSALFGHVTTVSSLNRSRVASLRVLIFAGERLPTRYLIDWMNTLPSAAYYNGYGPTEATGISCCHRIVSAPGADAEIPIGKPCTNTVVRLFDGEVLIDEPGKTGEIVIGGPGVALGYWRDPVKTAACFVTCIGEYTFEEPVYRTGDLGYIDSDGNLVFVGRKDRQIKHQGFRIELDDIEAALRSLDGIRDAAVVHAESVGNSELIAYFEADKPLDVVSIRKTLGAKLPQYMLPKRIVCLSALPRTDRGKIDYIGLKEATR